MPDTPEIAVLVSTYQRPDHLRRCLLSIALQQGVEGRFELVVTDDGSSDETHELVRRFAREVEFPVSLTSHPHDGFQLARCRNEGVAASSAPYLLFVDGDCLLPPNHLREHLALRRPGCVNGSDYLRLGPRTSARIDDAAVRRLVYRRRSSPKQWERLFMDHIRMETHRLWGWPRHPRLVGNNIALWRRDLERINGFDQKFRHWGWEDDDLSLRLRQAGLKLRSVRHRTRLYHLWHEQDPTIPQHKEASPNFGYARRRPFRLTRCCNGLQRRRPGDLAVRVLNGEDYPGQARALFPFEYGSGPADPEVEILFFPGSAGFSGSAQCNVLVLMEAVANPPLQQAHILVTDVPDLPFDPEFRVPLKESHRTWQLLE